MEVSIYVPTRCIFKGQAKDTCARAIVASHQGEILIRECLS